MPYHTETKVWKWITGNPSTKIRTLNYEGINRILPQGISINLHFPLKATAEIKKSTDSRTNNNSVVKNAFPMCSIQCIKSAKISLKWTVSHLYCQLAFQPLKFSECIAVEKITEAWTGIWAFKVLFIISQSWMLFFLFRKATCLLYHYLVIVSLLCPFLPYSPLFSHFLFCLLRNLQTLDYVFR